MSLGKWSKRRGRIFHLPVDHVPFMVDAAGFSCAVCSAFANKDGKLTCKNEDYRAYAGTDELIDPETKRPVTDPSKACSDWFTPRS